MLNVAYSFIKFKAIKSRADFISISLDWFWIHDFMFFYNDFKLKNNIFFQLDKKRINSSTLLRNFVRFFIHSFARILLDVSRISLQRNTVYFYRILFTYILLLQEFITITVSLTEVWKTHPYVNLTYIYIYTRLYLKV